MRRRVVRHLARAATLEALEVRRLLSLVGAYSFNEGAGTLVGDASGAANLGTALDAAWSAAGKFGGALSFDGTSSWVTVPDSPSLDLSGGMTLEAWINPAAEDSAWRTILMKERGTGMSWGMYADAPNHDPSAPSVWVNAGGPDVDAWGTAAAPVGAWTHVAGTYDGADLRLYVNGTLVRTVAHAGELPASADPLRIGGNGNGGEYFQGLIDEVRIYDHALTQAQIQADMNTPVMEMEDPNDPSVIGSWSPVMDWPLVAINTVLLRDGRVLMWDGDAGGDCIGSQSARVWNPATGLFTAVPIPYAVGHDDDIFCSAQALLEDGRVLVVGGHDCDGPELGIAMVNIFDPGTMTWTRGPDMEYRRWYPTATTLADGRVLVTAGSVMGLLDYVPYPELYDPKTNSWTTLAPASPAIPNYAFVFQNSDGRVIFAGSDEAKMATYALDVDTQTWSTVDPRILDAGSGVMYRPGRILKAGSSYLSEPADNGGNVPSAATTYVLDTGAGSPAWRQVGSMAQARTHLNLTVLPDGNVLATGGSRDIGGLTPSRAVLPAELWSPTTETWTTVATMATPRMYHSTALLLPDGRVLVAGGGRLGPDDFLSAEIYSPAYLFKGARPSITSSPATLGYGGTFDVGTPDSARIASVALIRNGSATHSFNMDQRYVPLNFTQTPTGLSVTAPADAETAPPGYYMLFIVDDRGVPSVAPVVRLPLGPPDLTPPTAPANVAAAGTVGRVSLSWNASTDDVGVRGYRVFRSTTPDFVISPANRVAESTGTSFDDFLPAGTYYYRVAAFDAAGNQGEPSDAVEGVALADTTAPSVSVTSPLAEATVSGVVTLTADASDNVAVAGVRFYVDGTAFGAEDTQAPYSIDWPSGSAANGEHVITAIARDASGNLTTSAAVNVTVQNTGNPGLVAAWGFNDRAGTSAYDLTGNGHTGAVSNATWVPDGRFSGALSFNGQNASVIVADAADLDLSGAMTLEAWVKPSALGDWRTILLKERGTNGLSYALYATDPNRSPSAPSVFVNTGGGDRDSWGAAALALDTWTHVAGTYDGQSLRVYVNGTLIQTVSVGGNILASDGALAIGGNSIWGEWFAGLIDEVRVYNRVLTAAEIQGDMNTPLQQGVSSDEVLVPQRPAKRPTRAPVIKPAPVVKPIAVAKPPAIAKPASVAKRAPVAKPVVAFPFSRSKISSRILGNVELLK